MQNTPERQFDAERYLLGMSEETKVALEGMLEAAAELRSWQEDSVRSGNGSLGFRRNTSKPDDLLNRILRTSSVVSRDMRVVLSDTEQEE